MQASFIFILRCSLCGLKGKINKYVSSCQCPKCQAVMKPSDIKANVSADKLRACIDDLRSKKNKTNVDKYTLGLLADSSDPTIRKVFDEVMDEDISLKKETVEINSSRQKMEQELSSNPSSQIKTKFSQQKNEPPQSTTEESTPKAFSIKSRYSALFWITLGSCIVVFNLNESVWGYTLGFCFILLGYFDFYAKLSEKYGNKIKTKMSEYKNKLREDRLTAAKESKDKEILHKLSMSDDEEIRQNVAKNIFTNHSDLILLSIDKSSEVRKNVADNPTIHSNMLMSLMEDEDEEVKNTAKKNYSEYVQDLIDTFDARKNLK